VFWGIPGSDETGGHLEVAVDLPAGWEATGDAAHRDGAAFFVSTVDNTFDDPCAHTERTPKVGGSVDSLAQALTDIPYLSASVPAPAKLHIYDATFVELSVPNTLPCAPEQFYLWQDSPHNHWWVLQPNETIDVWIVQSVGLRVAVTARTWPETSAEARAELRRVLDSIVFGRG
jgi:hypothetical protein